MNTNRHRQIAASSNPRVSPGRAGFVLPALLILAFVGVLFGLGRVLLFRYQCQQRIERQHELEKQYAVRSALRWIETRSSGDLTAMEAVESRKFLLCSRSDRVLDVDVRPVKPIYPSQAGHFNITNGASYSSADVVLSGPVGMHPVFVSDTRVCQIGPGTNTMGQVGQILVNMTGTGSWLDDSYGRRYMVDIGDINAPPSGKGDTVRLYISPTDSDAAIGMTVVPTNSTVRVDIWCRAPGGGVEILGSNVLSSASVSVVPANGKGLQLAENQIVAYYWKQAGLANVCGTYEFSSPCVIPDETLQYFREIGSDPDEQRGKDLEMVLEVENTGPMLSVNDKNRNTFKRFQVLPAYEFEVFLNWEGSQHEDEIATVVHVAPGARKKERENKAYIYDTPGVSVRGYARKRQD